MAVEATPSRKNTAVEEDSFAFGNLQKVLDEIESTPPFPIALKDDSREGKMKGILAQLPTFHGLTREDPDAFLLEFLILCQSLDYFSDAQQLKLFPSTLKDGALRWFMSLKSGSIRNWEDMQKAFLKKYRDPQMQENTMEQLLKIQQGVHETVEEYAQRMEYLLSRCPKHGLTNQTLKALFIAGLDEPVCHWLDNMYWREKDMADFSQLKDLCMRYRYTEKRGVRKERFGGSDEIKSQVITRAELNETLAGMKEDLLSALVKHMQQTELRHTKEIAALGQALKKDSTEIGADEEPTEVAFTQMQHPG